MAVRKRGKTWVVDYRVNGKRYVRAIDPNKRDAIIAEGKIRAQIHEGRFGIKNKIRVAVTFDQIIEKYLEHFSGKRSTSAETFHLNAIRSHFGPARLLNEIGHNTLTGLPHPTGIIQNEILCLESRTRFKAKDIRCGQSYTVVGFNF